MRLVTHNVNGIRAATRRGFPAWLKSTDADVVALQEVRARVDDLPLNAFGDYHVVYDPGELAGRNGVALLTRVPVASMSTWSGRAYAWGPGEVPAPLPAPTSLPTDDALASFAREGRWIEAELADAPVRVVSLYLPKGGLPAELVKGGTSREGHTPDQEQALHERKLAFLGGFARTVVALAAAEAAQGRELVVMGDYNVAHGPADLRNWKSNQANVGFLPAERAWFDTLVGAEPSASRLPEKARNASAPDKGLLIDVVRRLHPDEDGPYSWWSWRGQAFANDVGWRIDYHLATPDLAAAARRAWVDRAASGDERVSDHAPVSVDYEL